MQDPEPFPLKQLYDTLCNSSQIQKKFKFFLREFQTNNMHWIYETISTFQKILSSPKQLPIIKFNTLLAIKYCFDTCQYTLLTLIQVYLLNKIAEVALFRSKVKDQSLLVTYFTTEGYKESDHNDLKKVGYNYVMLAIEFVFVAAQIKKFRCVENIQIKQVSRYAAYAQSLVEKGIKRPAKFSFFLPEYIQQSSQKYQLILSQFSQQTCEIYSEYFLGIMIAQLQTGKKGPLDIKSLLSYGDAYLTSAMINLCEDQLSSMPQGLEHKRKYLNLFHEFVRWGDIQAVLMINNSDFITKISVNILTVKGDINLNQGQNIYPEIPGKKGEKKQFYIDFLRCLETWADCIPLNEEGNESNVRRIYIFLKQEKKFKFPQNLILKRYKKELQQNMKRNQQRNQKLLEIINNSEDDQNQSQIPKEPRSTMKRNTNLAQKEQPVTFDFLQRQIQSVQNALQQIVITKVTDQEASQKLNAQFAKLDQFKSKWIIWLDSIDLDSPTIQQEDQQKLQEIILEGDQTMEALQIISPLVQMFQKNKITLEDFLKRIKQTLDIHDDLTLSKSRRLQMTKSLKKSTSKSLFNTIQKSILNTSQHKNMVASKFDSSAYKPPGMTNSMHKSKTINPNPSVQKSHLANSLLKSNNQSISSSAMRRSRMYSKLNKLKEDAEQIAQIVESRNANFETLHSKISSQLTDQNVNKQPFKHIRQDAEEYFQQNKSIAIKGHREVIKEEERSEYSNSRKSIQSKKNYKKEGSLQSSRNNPRKSSELIQSPGSSKNFKSEKNITVVSKKSQKIQILEQQSKKVVQDMDISNEAEKIVVEYSDIQENQIQRKANQREKQEIMKNEMKRSKQKDVSNVFAKVKLQENKAKMSPKTTENKSYQLQSVVKSPKVEMKSPLSHQRNELKSPISQKLITFSEENNEYQNLKISKKTKIQPPSSTQKIPSVTQMPTRQKLADRLTPLNEDYGGKSQRFKKFDEIETPKRQDRLSKTKKSESKISVVSDDESMKSSKSIKEKLKSRISQRRSQIKQNTKRSLQSQIRAMKMEMNSNESKSLNKRKGGLLVTQISQESRLKIKDNERQIHLPNQRYQEKESMDLNKTKKVNETDEDFKNRNSQVEEYRVFKEESRAREEVNIPLFVGDMMQPRGSRNIEVSSVESKSNRKGISLSLGKKGSFIKSSRERESIIKQNNQIENKRQNKREEEPNHGKLREQYFSSNNIRISKDSNRDRIRKKLNSNHSATDSDSSCGDIMKSPEHKPMLDSHYSTQDIQKFNKLPGEKLEFKKYIETDLKKQIICPKTKEIEQIIKYGSKRNQISNFIQNNPNAKKAKSVDKFSYGSLMRDKTSRREVSELQDKLKALQNETKNIKTKLAVRDQEIKSFRNGPDKGLVEFTNPSQSNCFTSSDGFKSSRVGSQKTLFSPLSHQLLKPQLHNSSLIAQIKHAKSTPFKQYFQKVKGNIFKKTLLKSKSLIEKQDEIEIGCMNVRKEDYSLEVTVFISPLRFDLTDVNYSIIHDENLVSECHPKKVLNIELKKQQKIHIKMSVKNVPFAVPEFELTYKSKSEYSTNYFRLPIPTLFNKFCELESVPLSSFQKKSFSADRTMISSEFKLNTKVVKLEKIKEILPNFSHSKTKDLHILISFGRFKEDSFWVILKINEKNHAIMEGVIEEGQNFKYLQFLLVTLKNIFEVQREC